jgi:hypothetical protein
MILQSDDHRAGSQNQLRCGFEQLPSRLLSKQKRVPMISVGRISKLPSITKVAARS